MKKYLIYMMLFCTSYVVAMENETMANAKTLDRDFCGAAQMMIGFSLYSEPFSTMDLIRKNSSLLKPCCSDDQIQDFPFCKMVNSMDLNSFVKYSNISLIANNK